MTFPIIHSNRKNGHYGKEFCLLITVHCKIAILGTVMELHKEMGPGFLEAVYKYKKYSQTEEILCNTKVVVPKFLQDSRTCGVFKIFK